MTGNTRKKLGVWLRCILLIAVGLIMVYPLIWMVGATFKVNTEIFAGIGFIPKNPTFDGYRDAMKSYGGEINLMRSMKNTYTIVIPKVIFTLISATITSYGFSRFNFKAKNIMFAVLMSTLFLPQVVLNVPQYILYTKLGWVNSPWYLPLIVPMLKPALVSCGLFRFMWTSNDFMGPLLYVSNPRKYTASIFVKLSMDADAGFSWNRILASSLISILPSLIVFFAAQDSFIEGIAAGGVKG